MNIVEKRLDELQPYENNPRKNDNAVPYVMESIKRYGFKNPIIIDRNGVIVAGHTRYLASIELGLDGVIAFYFLGSVMMNILTMKTLQIGNISVFTCGIIMTPLVFACNDILTECMGKRFAFKVILIGAGINLAWSLICALMIHLQGNNEYISECFAVILGSTWRITTASIIAYIGSGYINNVIMSKLKERDGEAKYYYRAITSTGFGQLFDDYVFVFLAFAPFGISAIENPWSAILTVPLISAIVETIIEAIFTPVSKKICDTVKAEEA